MPEDLPVADSIKRLESKEQRLLKDKKEEEVHHMLPLSRVGTNDEDNLMSLYKSCHSKIHTKSRDRFGG